MGVRRLSLGPDRRHKARQLCLLAVDARDNVRDAPESGLPLLGLAALGGGLAMAPCAGPVVLLGGLAPTKRAGAIRSRACEVAELLLAAPEAVASRARRARRRGGLDHAGGVGEPVDGRTSGAGRAGEPLHVRLPGSLKGGGGVHLVCERCVR